jgi:O-antigen ligase
LGEVAFALWVILSLITPSWRYGPFAWLPLWEYEELAGAPMRVGLFNALPLVVVGCVVASRLLARREGVALRPWTWGPRAIALPLAGLTLWGTLRLDPGNFRLVFIYVGMYAVAWLVYLYAINERPRLLVPLAAVLIIQGAVAAGQFVAQRDLGLVPLGELPLHPAHAGNSVLWARGQPWLRAYGLTIHPNLLGAMMTALLLLLLPALSKARGAGRVILLVAVVAGGVGLLLSFSRGAWLGFVAGLVTWGLLAWLVPPCDAPSEVRRTFWRGGGKKKVRRTSESATHRWVGWLVVAALAAGLLYVARDMVFSRLFALDTPTEATSISERLRDAGLALAVFQERPLLGAGLGEYVAVAQRLDTDAARVHNAGLLVAAELGLPGLLLWLWLMVAPLWLWWRGRAEPARPFRLSAPGPQLAPWVAMLVVNTFDTTLWLSGNWQTSLLFGLVLAVASGEWRVISESVGQWVSGSVGQWVSGSVGQ